MARRSRGLGWLTAWWMGACAAIAACSSPDPGREPIGSGPGDASAATDGAAGDGGGVPTGDSGLGAQRLYSGGTRIKARFYDTTDGTSWFVNWRDTQLGASCSFVAAADGQLRCIPNGDGVAYLGSFNYFKDQACSQKIATAYAGGACPPVVPKYATTLDVGQCPAQTHVFSVGAKLAGTTAFFRDATNQCVQTTFSQTALYDVGQEVPASSFVSAQEQTGPDFGGVSAMQIVADDGARGFARFADAARGMSCFFRTSADGAFRCVPTSDTYVNTNIFVNVGCTTGAASRSTSACAAPKLASEYTQSGCDTVAHAFDTGALAATAYYKNGAACTSLGASPYSQYYSVGSEISATSFLEARLTAPLGTPRVQTKWIELRGEPHPYALHDAQRNEACSFGLAGDGIVRCLPTTRASVYFYSDAQCTNRLVYQSTANGCTAAPTLAALSDDAVCPTVTRIFAVGAQTNPAAIYVKFDNGQCSQTSISGVSFYTLGAEIPAASFMAAGEVLR